MNTLRVEEPFTAVGHAYHEVAEHPATCRTCKEEAELCTCPEEDCSIHG